MGFSVGKGNPWVKAIIQEEKVLSSKASKSKPKNLAEAKKVFSDMIKGHEALIKQIDKLKVVLKPSGKFEKLKNIFTRNFQKSTRALNERKEILQNRVDQFKVEKKKIMKELDSASKYGSLQKETTKIVAKDREIKNIEEELAKEIKTMKGLKKVDQSEAEVYAARAKTNKEARAKGKEIRNHVHEQIKGCNETISKLEKEIQSINKNIIMARATFQGKVGYHKFTGEPRDLIPEDQKALNKLEGDKETLTLQLKDSKRLRDGLENDLKLLRENKPGKIPRRVTEFNTLAMKVSQMKIDAAQSRLTAAKDERKTLVKEHSLTSFIKSFTPVELEKYLKGIEVRLEALHKMH